MTFRELAIGQVFRFASETDARFRFSGFERGPWEKISARLYRKRTTPFGTDAQALAHREWHGRTCEVGTVSVEVIPSEGFAE